MKLTRTYLRRAKDLEPLLADTAEGRGDVGYLPRAFVILNLPHSDPGEVPVWDRSNGDAVLILHPGYIRKDGATHCTGYPFGGTARWLLISLFTQAVRQKSPNLDVGKSLRQFVRGLGYTTDGRSTKHVYSQLTRLLNAQVQFQFRNYGFYAANSPIASEFFLWRNEKSDDRAVGFIRLAAPMLAGQKTIFVYLQKMNAIYFIPIFAVVVVGMLHRRVPAIAASIAMVAGILLISLGYFVPGFDAALKSANMHEFHFISIVFALLVVFMLVFGAIAPRREPWVLVSANDIDLTPWKGAKIASGVLIVLVISIYFAFAK